MERISVISDEKNIKYGVVISYVVMAVSLIGTVFISSRVLNLIGDYNYGLYSFVGSITSWVTVISSSLTASFLRYSTIEAKNSGTTNKTNTIYLKIFILLGGSVLILGLAIIGFLYLSKVCVGKYNWDDSRLLYGLFALSVINISITIPGSIFSLYVNYKKKFVFAYLLSLVVTLVNFAGQFLIAYFTRSIVFISIFAIVMAIVTVLANCLFSKTYLKIGFLKTSLSENKALVGSIIAFSSILLFNAVVDQINSNVDKTLLGIFSTPENVTIYHMGQQLNSYLVLMSISVSSVYAPTIHQLCVNGDRESLNALFLKVSKIQTIIICMVAFGFMACGKEFITWWIGQNRINAYYVGLVLMLIDICPLTMNASIEIQRADNKHMFRAIVYFAVALLNVLLSIVFLNVLEPAYAILACLLGSIIARLASHWIGMNIYNKVSIRLPVGRYLINLFLYIIVGIISYLIVFLLNRVFINSIGMTLVRFLIQGSVFVFLYLSICFVINIRKAVQLIKGFFRKE